MVLRDAYLSANATEGNIVATVTGDAVVNIGNVSSSSGTVSAGTMYPATRDLGGVYRFMGDIGRIAGALNSVVQPNSIQFVSIPVQGFSASATYASVGKTVSANVDTNTDPASQLAIGLRGTIGKGSIAAAVETLKYAAASAGADQATNTIISVGGNYDFGVAKLGAAYFDQKLALAGGSDGGKRVAYTVNLAAPVTKVITLGASYANYEVTPATAGAAKPKAVIMTVGAQYAFSKRTSIYASYQQVANSGADNALSAVSATGVNAGAAGSSRGLGVVEINGGTGTGFGLTAVHTF
jgi:predicted porin